MKETNLPEIIENKPIECLIYEVRGMPVMLDSDVAFFFSEKTERVNQQMKRNKNRFWTSQQKLDNKKSIPHINFILVWGFIIQAIHWSFKIVVLNVFSNNFNNVIGFPEVKINK